MKSLPLAGSAVRLGKPAADICAIPPVRFDD
jgi:hypothetical protein